MIIFAHSVARSFSLSLTRIGSSSLSRSFRATILVLLCSLFSVPGQAAPDADYWALWDVSQEDSDITVDHASWQVLLNRYLRTDVADGVHRFAYAAVQAEDRALLDGYITQLASIEPRTLSRAEQMAYWINLYNALTVQVVLNNPDASSILRMGAGFFSVGPWDDELLQVAGEALTLNDIEHRILRPIWRDHRIHYAVNCASIGCPDLAVSVWRADQLEQQLARAEQTYLNHPRGVQLDKRGRLIVSSLFDWYRGDFPGRDDEELLAYLASQINDATLAAALKAYEGRIRYEYDWQLNSVNQAEQ